MHLSQSSSIPTWFEVHLIEDGRAPDARRRLARVVRHEGHRTLEAETAGRPFFLAVGILADSPAREMERLMRLAEVWGACQALEEW
jgi:hypothetical protein